MDHFLTRQLRPLWALCGLMFVSFLCSGCPDIELRTGAGRLATTLPNNQLIFSNVQFGETTQMQFTLYNEGAQPITVSALEVVHDSGDNVFKLTKAPALPITLEPTGKSGGVIITVEFLAKQADSFKGRLLVTSKDAQNVDASEHFTIVLRNQILLSDPVFSCLGKLDFGAVEKGKSKTMECQIRNRGNAPLEVKGVEITAEKGTKDDFQWVSPAFPFVVPADKNTAITVRIAYKPSDYPPPVDESVMYLQNNTENKEERPSIRLVGKTAVPLITLIPFYRSCKLEEECKKLDSRLSCVADPTGGTSQCRQAPNTTPFLKFPLTSKSKTTRRSFVIRSTGDLPLKIEQLELDSGSSLDFRVNLIGLTFPIVLDPGKEKEITIEYTPSDDKEDKGRLSVLSNAGNLPKAPIILEADSHGCNLEVTPRKLKFPGAKSFQVTARNIGDESCVVEKIYFKDPAKKEFVLLPTPPPNQTIVPNGRIDFLVKYAPTQQSLRDNNILMIQSSDPDEPTIEIPLEGSQDTDECELKASPTSLNFQLVSVGRSKKLSFSLTNEGWGDCDLKSFNVLGTVPAGHTAFQLTTSIQAPTRLPAGQVLRLDLSYTPPQERSGYEGKLLIESNDKAHPQFSVSLLGASGKACLEILPEQVDFGSTKFGCATPTRDIEIFHLGASGCSTNITVNKIEFSTGTSPEFRFNKKPLLPANLTAGQSIKIELSYKAKDLGVDTGTVEIANNVPGQSQSSIPLIGEGVSTSDQKDVFRQNNRPEADILFVVDNSGSMSDDQKNLANNFKSFINWASQINVDYHIGVTTTDVTGSQSPAGCLYGSTKVITPQTPNVVTVFENNAKVGVTGSPYEQGLEAAYKALTHPTLNDPRCNKGFYRPDATLSIIILTDEPDQSPNPIGFYESFFKSLKGVRNLNRIRVSAIGPYDSNSTQCNAGSCRYFEVTKRFSGLYSHIKSTNWQKIMSDFGNFTFGYQSQFFLSRPADPKTLQVKVNGKTIQQNPQDGWSYDNQTNSITFTQSQLPPPGGTIEIQYQAICLP